MTAILPGATIGILGGGQLGRMVALAARDMGYDIRVLDPDPDPPARPIASDCIQARFDDVAAATQLARSCDIVTVDIERIAIAALDAAAAVAPMRPASGVVAIVQRRERQKTWLVEHGFPVSPFRAVASGAECESAVQTLGPSYIKASTGGYDGRGQVFVADPAACAAAWVALRVERGVVEQALDLEQELSVLVARRPGGEYAVYPPSLNHHEAGQLAWAVVPAPISATRAAAVTQLGVAIAATLDVVGLLAIELFVARGGMIYVNELAPRPHNSFHHTMEACATSQFEQLVRAICDLPLGSTAVAQPSAIANILGSAWRAGPPDVAAALAVPGTRIHLYGKREPRPARKMGHIGARGDTTDEALARSLDARRRLTRA